MFLASLAACVVSVLAAILSFACARSAIRSSMDSKAASKAAGTTLLRAELDEMRDAFEKNSRLLAKINSRERMRDARAAGGDGSDLPESAQRPGETPQAWKDRMRRSLIVAGKPAKHG
jgi:hypothetical protein